MPSSDAPVDPGLRHYIALAIATPGAHLQVGPAGYALYCGSGIVVGGADCDPVKAACIAADLPVIDCRGLDTHALHWIVDTVPIAAVDVPVSPLPWGPLSFAPLAVVAALFRVAGAEVLNIEEPGTWERDTTGTDQ